MSESAACVSLDAGGALLLEWGLGGSWTASGESALDIIFISMAKLPT